MDLSMDTQWHNYLGLSTFGFSCLKLRTYEVLDVISERCFVRDELELTFFSTN